MLLPETDVALGPGDPRGRSRAAWSPGWRGREAGDHRVVLCAGAVDLEMERAAVAKARRIGAVDPAVAVWRTNRTTLQWLEALLPPIPSFIWTRGVGAPFIDELGTGA